MGIVKLAKAIQNEIPGTYVKCITTSNSVIKDIEDTYFMPINDQLDYVCRMIHEDKNLSNGLHMIGISQGGLFVRALVQKCNLSKVGTVVSIGGPQQGIFGIPKCTIDGFIHLCLLMNELLSYGAYIKFIQSHYNHLFHAGSCVLQMSEKQNETTLQCFLTIVPLKLHRRRYPVEFC
ncbi:unnamed protein product [Schistosoma bovis]|nr:unnamed protein product [Schistosoma bovis]